MNGSDKSSSSVLRLTDVCVSFGKLKILNGVTFSIQPNTTVGVIGPNGSGKTTLFNCLSGFVPASSGEIWLHGNSITDVAPHQRAAAGIGRVFQNFGVFREMTVLENLITALESSLTWYQTLVPFGSRYRVIKDEAFAYLKQVNLQDKADSKAGSLSGGQMRLLEIMRTVAFKANLFLLDEPTAGVSPKMKESISDLIIQLQAMGKTVLVIEHDINFIQRFCSRILVLDGGKVVLDDTPELVRADARLQEIYFGGREANDTSRHGANQLSKAASP